MCDHDGLDEECGPGCKCPCMSCLFPEDEE
jgi:hypothetical protein